MDRDGAPRSAPSATRRARARHERRSRARPRTRTCVRSRSPPTTCRRGSGVLNDTRLVLGTRLGVTEEEPDIDPDAPEARGLRDLLLAHSAAGRPHRHVALRSCARAGAVACGKVARMTNGGVSDDPDDTRRTLRRPPTAAAAAALRRVERPGSTHAAATAAGLHHRRRSPPRRHRPAAGATSAIRRIPSARTSGLAIASLVLGIVWVFWLGSLLAVIFGHVALSQIKRSMGALTGRGTGHRRADPRLPRSRAPRNGRRGRGDHRSDHASAAECASDQLVLRFEEEQYFADHGHYTDIRGLENAGYHAHDADLHSVELSTANRRTRPATASSTKIAATERFDHAGRSATRSR